MRLPMMLWPGLLWVLCSASLAADDQTDKSQPGVKTAKERLANKAADAQRLNDCKIPFEQRDPDHPRPDDCGEGSGAETSDRSGQSDEQR